MSQLWQKCNFRLEHSLLLMLKIFSYWISTSAMWFLLVVWGFFPQFPKMGHVKHARLKNQSLKLLKDQFSFFLHISRSECWGMQIPFSVHWDPLGGFFDCVARQMNPCTFLMQEDCSYFANHFPLHTYSQFMGFLKQQKSNVKVMLNYLRTSSSLKWYFL